MIVIDTIWYQLDDYQLRTPGSRQGGSRYLVYLVGDSQYHPLRVFGIQREHGPCRLAIMGNLDIPPEAVQIVNKHLVEDGDLLLCQDELIEAGFSSYSRL